MIGLIYTIVLVIAFVVAFKLADGLLSLGVAEVLYIPCGALAYACIVVWLLNQFSTFINIVCIVLAEFCLGLIIFPWIVNVIRNDQSVGTN